MRSTDIVGNEFPETVIMQYHINIEMVTCIDHVYHLHVHPLFPCSPVFFPSSLYSHSIYIYNTIILYIYITPLYSHSIHIYIEWEYSLLSLRFLRPYLHHRYHQPLAIARWPGRWGQSRTEETCFWSNLTFTSNYIWSIHISINIYYILISLNK